MSRSLLGKALMLVGAALVLGLIIVGVTGEITREGQKTPSPVRNPQTSPILEQTELQRCHAIGEAATQDAACLALWAETRRRFLSPELPPGEGG